MSGAVALAARVAELEQAARDVVEAAEAGCSPAEIARPARRVLAGLPPRREPTGLDYRGG